MTSFSSSPALGSGHRQNDRDRAWPTEMFSGSSQFDINGGIFINHTPNVATRPLTTIPSSSNLVTQPTRPPLNTNISLVENEVYAQLLLMRRKGYPLWQPKPDDGVPLAYLREGVQIGDLGILNEFGGFDYIFNVCRPADDPINDGRVPEDFKPITGLKDQDTRKREDEYWPGTHVASRDVDIQRGFLPLSPSPLPNAPVEIGGGLSFGSRSSRGALLVLPEGATRRDHLNLSAFHSYATQYAKSWYAYINGPLGRQATNGSLYLVTGCDKARAWGVASFSGARPGDVLLEFVPVPSRVPDSTHPDYYFRLTNSASASSGSDCRFGNQSGCVFLRGFKIAIRTPKFTSLQLGVVVSSIMDLDSGNLVPNRKRAAIVLSSSRFLKFSLGKKKVVGSGIQESTPLGSSVDIQVFPSRHPVYHPSDIINQYLLQNSRTDVVATHDNLWCSILSEEDNEIPQNWELIRRIEHNFTVKLVDGHAQLRPSRRSLLRRRLSRYLREHSTVAADVARRPFSVIKDRYTESLPSLPPPPHPEPESEPSHSLPTTSMSATVVPSTIGLMTERTLASASTENIESEPSLSLPAITPYPLSHPESEPPAYSRLNEKSLHHHRDWSDIPLTISSTKKSLHHHHGQSEVPLVTPSIIAYNATTSNLEAMPSTEKSLYHRHDWRKVPLATPLTLEAMPSTEKSLHHRHDWSEVPLATPPTKEYLHHRRDWSDTPLATPLTKKSLHYRHDWSEVPTSSTSAYKATPLTEESLHYRHDWREVPLATPSTMAYKKMPLTKPAEGSTAIPATMVASTIDPTTERPLASLPTKNTYPDNFRGISLGFQEPRLLLSATDLMEGSFAELILTPEKQPVHIQAQDWHDLLHLLMAFPYAEIETTRPYAGHNVQIVVQLARTSLTSSHWNIILWLTLEKRHGDSDSEYTQQYNAEALPSSYNGINIPDLLCQGTGTGLSKICTLPSTELNPYPVLPLSFPDLLVHLQRVEAESRENLDTDGIGRLSRIISECYLDADATAWKPKRIGTLKDKGKGKSIMPQIFRKDVKESGHKMVEFGSLDSVDQIPNSTQVKLGMEKGGHVDEREKNTF